MSTHRHSIVVTALVSTVAAIALVTPISASGADEEGYKLEGAWVAKVQGSPVQWTYTMSPDPSGRRAAVTVFVQVGIAPSADDEFDSPIVGEAVKIDDRTVVFNSIFYTVKKGLPFDQIVYIGMDSGEMRLTGPGKAEGTHYLAIYDPSSDQDGDGIPDPGAIPLFAFPLPTVETRLPLSPP